MTPEQAAIVAANTQAVGAIQAALIAAVVAIATALITTLITVRGTERRLRREFQLEFATEAALKALLEVGGYKMRSFDKIKHHLHGFSDENALRLHLIRAGAVHFTGNAGEELWGLLEKNKGEAFK
jgi:hypothetical protein